MKKFTSIFFVVSIVLYLVSCASTPSSQESVQENVQEEFEEVYHNYEQYLILDDAQNYKVQNGDTLSKIAKSFYGDDNGYYFPLIMLASSETILDPDLIEPNMELVIPDLNKNLANKASQGKLKSFFRDLANVYKNKTSQTAEKTRQELLKISNSL